MTRDKIGIVVIGRNEGERLVRCLKSFAAYHERVVYVDSGSTDDSLCVALKSGAKIVELESSMPFSAGRARNAGFEFLRMHLTDLKYVQFVDGDCEVCEGWIEEAVLFLDNATNCAVVAGRVKEKYPEKTIYNQLCDFEWNTPIGEALSCGGIFMVRKMAFEEVHGFNTSLIAGEEPELCYRLRQEGWKIQQIEHLMAYHDAAIFKFSQWWKRAIRSGHAYAQGLSLYGFGKERYRLKDTARIWGWALILPGSAVLLSVVFSYWWLLLFTVYGLHWLKISADINYSLQNWYLSFVYALFNIISKWPQLYGQLLFFYRSFRNEKLVIIEYK